jgi:hypothetical protein
MAEKNVGVNPDALKEMIELSWLNLGKEMPHHVLLPACFMERSKDELENPLDDLLSIIIDPKNFYFTCKHLFEIELLPFQLCVLDELWHRKYPMLVGSRGMGKSFILGLYAMLRALLCQGSKIIIVGAAFRQSKVIFDYCNKIWNNSPILRNMCENYEKNGPKTEVDKLSMYIGESVIMALPIGDGSKIRGQRANYIICDEFASVNPDIYENVISGFAAVSANPVEQVKLAARSQVMKDLDIWTMEQQKLVDNSMGNQAILSGTAYYDFNHFSKYWKNYKSIILSEGKPEKLKEIFPEGVPDSFNYKDYSIMRFPVEILPKGFMDEKHVARSKATVHNGIYVMEYGACHSSDTKIITNLGVKDIVDVNIGDLVLTHKGRFRKVINKTYRKSTNCVMSWSTYGNFSKTITTSCHPFWNGGDDWVSLGGITGFTKMSKLVELNNEVELDLSKICIDYMECGNSMYPIHSQTKLKRQDINDIKELNKNNNESEIARMYGVSPSTINTILKKQRFPKNAIPQKVKLDFDFGLMIGYYASEGNCGANNRSVEFSLDGHVNIKLEAFVEQLISSCKKVFNITPKVYHKKNVACVVLHQSLLTKIMKYICPGISHTKLINHDILFSNPDFLKGFITGYWNGDGHWRKDKDTAIATCVNLSLLCQVRLALSYFGINSSLRKRKLSKSIFRGKEYDCRQAYSLVLNGENCRKFKYLFYNEPCIDSNNKQHVSSNDNEMLFEIVDKMQIDYDDFVYNLEVEEDNSYSLLNATVHNCFATDSNGFFKRSLIESCVTNEPINDIQFQPSLVGHPNKKYIYGVDPASEQDNFSIVVIELCGNHRRIVYVWTTTRNIHKEKMKRGLSKDKDFYGYCARKIRELMVNFPCERIVMDSQGGGVAVEEALHDSDKLKEGELPIWPIIVDGEEKDSDDYQGHHILETVNFAKADWVRDANHGLRKDFEDKVLLFPFFDALSLGFAVDEDRAGQRIYDTLEDCICEIEELKDELATIVHTQTGTAGRDRWDTPEIKMPGGKKGRMRKDRYSALLMANMTARTLQRSAPKSEYNSVGGFSDKVGKSGHNQKMYVGNNWYNVSAGVYKTVSKGV